MRIIQGVNNVDLAYRVKPFKRIGISHSVHLHFFSDVGVHVTSCRIKI